MKLDQFGEQKPSILSNASRDNPLERSVIKKHKPITKIIGHMESLNLKKLNISGK